MYHHSAGVYFFTLILCERLTADTQPGPPSWCSLLPGCAPGQRSSWPASPGWWRRSERGTCCLWSCEKTAFAIWFQLRCLWLWGRKRKWDIRRSTESARYCCSSGVVTEMTGGRISHCFTQIRWILEAGFFCKWTKWERSNVERRTLVSRDWTLARHTSTNTGKRLISIYNCGGWCIMSHHVTKKKNKNQKEKLALG